MLDMELGGEKLSVRAAVSDSLPVSVLLGTNASELGSLLNGISNAVCRSEGGEAMVVTRVIAKEQERMEVVWVAKEQVCGWSRWNGQRSCRWSQWNC